MSTEVNIQLYWDGHYGSAVFGFRKAFFTAKPNIISVEFDEILYDKRSTVAKKILNNEPIVLTSEEITAIELFCDSVAKIDTSVDIEKVQSNWLQEDSSSPSYIINKPNLHQVAISGSYNDLKDKPTIVKTTWNNIEGKPNTFTPSKHKHEVSDITNLQSQLDAKQPVGSYASTSALNTVKQTAEDALNRSMTPGPQGPIGPQGPAGKNGSNGAKGDQGPRGFQGPSGKDGIQGPRGLTGYSAYQIAVNNGYSGTEKQWLESLKGKQGIQGPAGQKGQDGRNGLDGARGSIGPQGKSAYQVAVDNGFIGPMESWLASLKGDKGDTGSQGPKGDRGYQGYTGPSGNDGRAATIQIGKVSTGLAGSTVEVINKGTSTDAILDFKIPRGENGSRGDNGATYTPRVDSYGYISWINDKNLPNPESVYIKGPRGERGLQGKPGTPADVSALIPRVGNRGNLAGQEQVSSMFGSQTISATSPDTMFIQTSGATTLTFTSLAEERSAVKEIALYALSTSTLSVIGAEWANKDTPPKWGTAGKSLVLLANFIGGRVILTVSDNNE